MKRGLHGAKAESAEEDFFVSLSTAKASLVACSAIRYPVLEIPFGRGLPPEKILATRLNPSEFEWCSVQN